MSGSRTSVWPGGREEGGDVLWEGFFNIILCIFRRRRGEGVCSESVQGERRVLWREVEVEEMVVIKIAEKFFFSGTPTQTRRAERDTIQPTTNAARAEFIAETELNKKDAGREAICDEAMRSAATVSAEYLFFSLHPQFVL